MAKCKGCGADISWVTTSKGKSMPVDVPLVAIIDKLGEIHYGQVPHWGTCPKAKKFNTGEGMRRQE